MKKQILFLFVVLVSGILLSSFSNPKKDIVGKWKLSGRSLDLKTSDEEITEKVKLAFEARNKKSEDVIIEYTADKKVMIEGQEVGTYSISKDKLTVTDPDFGTSSTCDVIISGDSMILIADETSSKSMRASSGISHEIDIEKLIISTTFTRVK